MRNLQSNSERNGAEGGGGRTSRTRLLLVKVVEVNCGGALRLKKAAASQSRCRSTSFTSTTSIRGAIARRIQSGRGKSRVKSDSNLEKC